MYVGDTLLSLGTGRGVWWAEEDNTKNSVCDCSYK